MEAVGAAASIVGIVSFGLGLAKNLQAFIESMIEAKITIALIMVEVNITASTLQRLQDIIEKDQAASEQENRPTILNDTCVNDIKIHALRCRNIYVQIMTVIEKASIQNSEDESDTIRSQSPAADDPDALAGRLAVFSEKVTKLGRHIRWPWLEIRIKRCQDHLGRVKIDLMLSLQTFSFGEILVRHSGARISGTDEECEERDKLDTLLKKRNEMRAKKVSLEQSSRQLPGQGSDNGASEGADASSTTSNASTPSIYSLSSSEILNDPPAPSSPHLGSERGHMSRRTRRTRKSRASRTLRAFKFHVRKRLQRNSVFKKDSKSVVFEAYLIYPFPDPFPEGGSAPPPIKLPFGHRRLTREIKRTLRKCNPWDILVVLSPHHRAQFDQVVQQVQLAATGTTDVCVVAIDVDGYSNVNISGLKAGDLVWTRMVLFFRHEPVQAREGAAEAEIDVIRGRPRLTATVRNIFRGSQRQRTESLELQKLKREQEDNERVEEERRKRELKEKIDAEMAKLNAETRAREDEERVTEQKQWDYDRRVSDEARFKLLKTQRQEDDDERRRQEEQQELGEKIRNPWGSISQSEMAARQRKEREDQEAKEKIENEIDRLRQEEDDERRQQEEREVQEEVERIFCNKRLREMTERQRRERQEQEEEEQREHDEAVKNEVARQMWRMERQRADRERFEYKRQAEEERQRKELEERVDAEIAKRGAERVRPRPVSPFAERPMQGVPPPPGMTLEMGRLFSPSYRPAGIPQPPPPPLGGMSLPSDAQDQPTPRKAGALTYPPGWSQWPPPLPGGHATRPPVVHTAEGGRSKKEKRRAKKTLDSFSGSRQSKKGGEGKRRDSKSKTVDARDNENSEDTEKGESLEDIDKELGLDDLEATSQMTAKDVDELLQRWTNVGGQT